MVKLWKNGLPLVVVPAILAASVSACSRGEEARKQNGNSNAGEASSSPAEAKVDLAALASDPKEVAAGKKLFSNCSMCHSVEANTPSPAGPHLDTVIGRRIASVSDFPYSPALKGAVGTWTPAALDAFLKNPQAAYPGTAMAYAGIAKEEDRKAIIAFLASHSGD